jgi:hypothetical protein
VTNKEGTLDDLYFEWLYKKIGVVSNRNPNKSYWELARHLYRTPFFWVVPNDDNREADGKDLRQEFIAECDIQDIEINWLQLDCSVLEMLIALAGLAAFNSVGEAGDWFRKFLDNLKLRTYTDANWNTDSERQAAKIIERLVDRTYNSRGVGGLFPLKNAEKDQRKEELWYQLSAYLAEGDYLNSGP